MKKFNAKKTYVFTFIMTIIGAIIGAGFASGKEVASFFGQFGFWVFPFLLLVAGLFFFCFYLFSKLGKAIKPQSISDLTTAMFGKAGTVVDFVFIISAFITLSSMLAGCDSIGKIVFQENYNFCYLSILTALIVTIIVSVGLKYIFKTTDFILPIMMVVLLVIVVVFFATSKPQSISSDSVNFNVFSLMLYSFLYVSMNTFYNIFIISKTSQYLDKKHTTMSSLLTSGILFVLIGVILLSIFHGGDIILKSEMPMLQIASGLGQGFSVVYSVILWLAIFTTICTCAYTIVEWLNTFLKNKFVCSVIVLTLAFIFSRFGFATIVDIFYPIEGIFGTIFIAYSAIFYFKNKKNFDKISAQNDSLSSDDLALLSKKTADASDEVKTEISEQNQVKSLKIEKKNGKVFVTKKYKNGAVEKSVNKKN